MVDRKSQMIALVVGLALVALNLAALNYLLAGWSGARIDLTEENVFSISPATERILDGLDEDLTIYGYFSKRTHPKLAPLVPEITDLLDEYREVSKGRVHFEIIDPGEDEAAEEEAADRYGVRSTPFRLASKYESAIVNAYFALVVKYGDQYVRYGFEDLIEVKASPDGDIDVRLRNPEYDLTRAIKKVVYGFRGTGELFDRIEGPVRLTAIWSLDSLPEIFAEVPEAVRKAAAGLTAASGGRFTFEEIDPSGDKAKQEEVYQRFGAPPMSLGLFGDTSFYLYALLEVGSETEQIVLTGESITAASIRESVENSLRRHTPGFLKTVGIVTPEPPRIPEQLRRQMQLPPPPPPEFEEIKAVLRQDYQVREVALDSEAGVPTDVDILLVLKPNGLEDTAVYNLDQYLMRGGRIIVCAGNYSVNFGAGGLSLSPIETGLEDWLEHLGVTVDKTLVLDDRNQPLPIPEMRSTPFGNMRTWTVAPYPYLVQVRDDGFMDSEITRSLDSVGIYWGSPLVIDEDALESHDVISILQSSEMSWTDDNLASVAYVNYEVPAEGTERHLLAAALSGRFKSYYADRPSPFDKVEEKDEDAEEGDSGDAEPPRTVTLKESPETRLVVVGDSEYLSDFVARALSQVDGGFFIENLRFAQNLIDWTAMDDDMLDIRARGLASRRLQRVSQGTEVLTESFNYVLPVVILAALGIYLHWRRRRTVPLIAGPVGDATTLPVSHREA